MNLSKQLRLTRQKVLLLFTGILLSVSLIIPPANSLSIRSSEQITIAANEVIKDDVYLAGKIITIDGTIQGDAIAFGNQINLNGTVEGDLIAAGQAVVINGTVRDDARVASQALQLGTNARIGDDTVAAGFSLESKPGSTIGGDLAFAGVQSLLAGSVRQELTGLMAALELRGTVGKNVNIIVGDEGDEPETFYPPFLPQSPIPIPKLRAGLTIANSAQIGSKLIYKSNEEGKIDQGAQIAGGTVRENLDKEAMHSHSAGQPNPAQVLFWQLQRFLALLLVGALLLRLVPSWLQRLVATVQTQPLPSLGWGIITFLVVGLVAIAIPLTTILLAGLFAVTIPILIIPVLGIGMLANLALLVGLIIFASFVPQIAISFLGGRWLLQKLRSSRSSEQLVALIVGLVAFVILTAIPVLGAIFSLFTFFLGLGALCLWGQTKLNRASSVKRQLTPV